MKKVLLTSAVVLTTFGAAQVVSADQYSQDYDNAKVAAEQKRAAEIAKEISTALTPKNKAVLDAYSKFTKAEDAYNTVEARLKAVQAELTRLYLAQKEISDIAGDSTQLDEYYKASEAVYSKAVATANENKAAGLKTVADAAGKALEKAQEAQSEAQTALDAAVKAGQKDPEELKKLEKALNDAKEATKKATDAKVKADKDYNDQVAKEEKAVVDAAEAKARMAAIVAKKANDNIALEKAVAGLERKVTEKEEELNKLAGDGTNVGELATARKTRDDAKKALEAAEDAAKEVYGKYGLSYNRDNLVTALDTKPEEVVGWKKTDKGQWNYVVNAKGEKATAWLQVDGAWYYFNAEGVMQKWWVKDGNTWYYLNGSGQMQTGWLQDGGKWYYLENSGAMKASQWFQVGDKWYYVDGSGALAVNTTVNGYTVNGNGEWV